MEKNFKIKKKAIEAKIRTERVKELGLGTSFALILIFSGLGFPLWFIGLHTLGTAIGGGVMLYRHVTGDTPYDEMNRLVDSIHS